jgi:hypothetical protein
MRPFTLYLTADLREGLEQIREHDGLPYAEQIRRALTLYFADRHVRAMTRPAKASTRRRKGASDAA